MTKHKFNKGEIVERFIKSRGKGGQNVNKLSSAVYLKHIYTGIEVKCDKSRYQSVNRKLARAILLGKIEEHRQKKAAGIISDKERQKRRNRKRPRWLKEKILFDKKKKSEKKKTRRSIEW